MVLKEEVSGLKKRSGKRKKSVNSPINGSVLHY